MKISTKGRYALRILIDIAQYQSEKNVSVRQIAERQGISEKYLEGIIAKLNHAKLVKSVRGKYGGYKLTAAPSEYTVFDVLNATEESMAVVACLDETTECCRTDECSTVKFWQELQDHIHNYLKAITIEDVMNGKVKP